MHSGPREEHDPNFNYEVRDLSIPTIRKGTIGLFAFVIFCIFAAGGVLIALYPNWLKADAPPQPLRLPKDPNPLLQTNISARTDIQRMRQTDRHALENYSWVDEGRGQVRIPIDRAIERLARQGLPQTETVPVPRGVDGELHVPHHMPQPEEAVTP